jgi:hypothetical protein
MIKICKEGTVDKARRDRLTLEQREEMNARRRAVRQNKSNEERNAN